MTYTAASPLDAPPQATQEQALAFLTRRGLDEATAATIVSAYWIYAPLARLDPVLALAQGVHEASNVETGKPFSSWWALRHNVAGVGVTGESRPHTGDGAPDWQVKEDGLDYRGYAFPTWDAGILAHVVHLAAYRYASGSEPATILPYFTTRYDPRLLAVRSAGFRGVAKTLGDLNGRWAVPGVTYGQDIASVANLIVATPGPAPVPVGGSTMVPKPPMVSNPAVNRGGYDEPIRKEAIFWHVTAGTNSLSWLTGKTSGVSTNYLIDFNGTIRELVPWQEAAWVQGIVNTPDLTNPLIAGWVREGNNPNCRATGIECESPGKCGQPGGITAAQQASLIVLSAWLCQEQEHAATRERILRHSQLDSINRACCPGYDEQTEMLPWIAQAARLLAGGATRDGFAAWWRAGGTFGARWRGLRGAKGATG